MCDGTETGHQMTDAETTSTDTGNTDAATGGEQKQQEQTFTQAEVDRIVRDRLSQQAKNKFGDYDELKTQAAGAKTLEERLADVESRYKAAELNALRSDVAAKHGLSAEDRDLFLTGADAETLTAQATRLADRVAAVKKQGNVAPNEGDTKTTGTSEEQAERALATGLFGGSD